MALPASGPLSFSEIRTELGASNGAISLNDTNVRTLAGKPSGVISLADLRGKANVVNGTISTSLTLSSGYIVGSQTRQAYPSIAGIIKTISASFSWTGIATPAPVQSIMQMPVLKLEIIRDSDSVVLTSFVTNIPLSANSTHSGTLTLNWTNPSPTVPVHMRVTYLAGYGMFNGQARIVTLFSTGVVSGTVTVIPG